MSADFFKKESCLNRAKQLLERNDDALLRYDCLELRFCLESITYDKLRTYIKRLPESVLKKWQPPQAVRALLELEPFAEEDFELLISPESAPGIPTGNWVCLGHHKTFKLSWLRKTYNKLGNFLHVPPPKSRRRERSADENTELRKYLEEVVAELEPIVASTLDASLAQVVTFTCKQCGDPIVANVEGVKHSRRTECLNPNCRAEFALIETEDVGLSCQLMISAFPCRKCSHQNHIENRKLTIGYRFSCEKCGEPYEIVWGYRLVNEGDQESS